MITRNEFVEKIKIQLDELNSGIEKIELKAKTVREKAKGNLQKRIRYLRHKLNSAAAKVQEVKDSGEDTWHDLQQAADTVVDSLKSALVKTMAHFKKNDPGLMEAKITE